MAEISLISTTKDPASRNILSCLLEEHGFKESGNRTGDHQIYSRGSGDDHISLHTIDSDLVFSEEIDKTIRGDFLIFLSRHSSMSGTPSLSAHFTGNFQDADLGGSPRSLSMACPILLKRFMRSLKRNASGMAFDVTMESTHHGPLLSVPSMFVEIGSDESRWKDKDAGSAIARSLIESLQDKEDPKEIAIGFGGTHYCQNFNKVLLETDIAMSHICPKHSIHALDDGLILQMAGKSYPKATVALLDWKGMDSGSKAKLVPLLEKAGIKYRKTKEILGKEE